MGKRRKEKEGSSAPLPCGLGKKSNPEVRIGGEENNLYHNKKKPDLPYARWAEEGERPHVSCKRGGRSRYILVKE